VSARGRALLLLALLGCPAAAATAQAPDSSLVRAEANDNRRSAGTLERNVLTVRLVARRARWHPEQPDGPSLVADALGEEGRPPSIPAPLIRVRAGTRLVVRVRNELPDTLLLFGLRSRAASDTVRVPPGATVETRASAPPPGAYLYRGATAANGKVREQGYGQQLAGALIVDPSLRSGQAPAGGPRTPDRVFVIGSWQLEGGPFVMAMNGRSWPHTERLAMTVGDSVRWRVLSSTNGLHPMHLHGFYFRVDSRGGWDADTIYTPAQRRHAVTEIVPVLGSISISWTPERAGNWLFHCHDALHTTWRRRANLNGKSAGPAPRPVHDGAHDAARHADEDMSGLILGIHVSPRAGATPPAADTADDPARHRHRLRIVVTEKPRVYRQHHAYSFVRATVATPRPTRSRFPVARWC
jgi:manganese oxidase